MSETIGLIKCPICGQIDQEIRVNKRGHLYTYCSAGCRITYPNPVTLRGKPALKSGRIFTYNGYEMRPLAAENQETIINKPAGVVPAVKTEVKHDEPRISGNTGRNPTIGRTDRQPAATAGNTNSGEYRPSGLLGWLWDDDTDDD